MSFCPEAGLRPSLLASLVWAGSCGPWGRVARLAAGSMVTATRQARCLSSSDLPSLWEH